MLTDSHIVPNRVTHTHPHIYHLSQPLLHNRPPSFSQLWALTNSNSPTLSFAVLPPKCPLCLSVFLSQSATPSSSDFADTHELRFPNSPLFGLTITFYARTKPYTIGSPRHTLSYYRPHPAFPNCGHSHRRFPNSIKILCLIIILYSRISRTSLFHSTTINLTQSAF